MSSCNVFRNQVVFDRTGTLLVGPSLRIITSPQRGMAMIMHAHWFMALDCAKIGGRIARFPFWTYPFVGGSGRRIRWVGSLIRVRDVPGQNHQKNTSQTGNLPPPMRCRKLTVNLIFGVVGKNRVDEKKTEQLRVRGCMPKRCL